MKKSLDIVSDLRFDSAGVVFCCRQSVNGIIPFRASMTPGLHH
jgi:hypothetical protein